MTTTAATGPHPIFSLPESTRYTFRSTYTVAELAPANWSSPFGERVLAFESGRRRRPCYRTESAQSRDPLLAEGGR